MDAPTSFAELGLPQHLLDALRAVGYEAPSPIQAATIPPLMQGSDVLGTAQTGTGKTAAFALPILAQLDATRMQPQALVLAPTRELAIQVAEAFQRYAQHIPDFHVLPIYGGQGYGQQLHGLRRGAHVIVGTPGRVKDHLERGTLDLSGLRFVVLDEADEMLRMGFIDEVEIILKQTPAARQTALFSATMPAQIRRIAQTYLREPREITIKAKTETAAQIRQRYWLVSGVNKLDALTRILEAERFEAMIVFARTKQGTEELAERLQARGFAAAAINGDLPQPLREKTIARLREAQLDILVATDVAARGLDVERVSHVLNYDIPYDSEAYVHRIGRTGRAGRSGEAILFVAPRERHLLRAIERATRQPIEQMWLPSIDEVNDQRVARFHERIARGLEAEDLDLYRGLIQSFVHDREVSELDVAAALARQLQGDTPLLMARAASVEAMPEVAPRAPFKPRDEDKRAPRARPGAPESAPSEARPPRAERPSKLERPSKPERPSEVERVRSEAPPRKSKPASAKLGFESYRVEVGHRDGVRPGNLVGAIANEAGLDSQFIGQIRIEDDHSVVELPEGMPKEIFHHLKKVWVAGRKLEIRKLDEQDSKPAAKRFRPREDQEAGQAAPRKRKPKP